MEKKFEDFEVHTEWVHEATDDTLIAYLPGFRKEQLKVQTTSTGNLRISGERSIGDNIFSRFIKEILIPSNCDQNKIKANFSGGMLHVKFHKLVVQAEPEQVEEEAKPSAKVPIPKPDQKPATDHVSPPEKQKKQRTPPPPPPPPTPTLPKATMEKQADEKKDEVEKKKPEMEKEMKAEKNAANEAEEKSMKEEKGTTSEKLEEHGDPGKGSAAEDKAKLEPKQLDQVGKYLKGIDYKQVLEGLIKELKNPRKIMNMVLTVLVVLIIGVYVKNAIRFLTNYYD